MAKRPLLILFHVFALPMMLCSLSAQEVITQKELAQYVSAYAADKYSVDAENIAANARYSLNAPSLNNNNSLQVGMGIPGMSLLAMLDLFWVDSSIDIDFNNTLSDQLANQRYYRTKERYVPSITLDYGYRVKRWLTLGAKGAVGFRTRGIRHKVTNDLLYRDSRVVATLLFNMRFDWLHRRNIMMYSSLGLGVASIFDYNDGMVFPMFDATYVGLTAGRKLYYFLELGGGASGIIRTGIGCRF